MIRSDEEPGAELLRVLGHPAILYSVFPTGQKNSLSLKLAYPFGIVTLCPSGCKHWA